MSQPFLNPTPPAVRAWRFARLAWHLVVMCVGSAVIFPWVDVTRRRALKRQWSGQILAILGVQVELADSLPAVSGLILANHISWLDIVAINTVRPAAFIAKSEVRRWPLIGWLSARNETVFLRRGSHGHARVVNAEIDALLTAGVDVAVFPEGTTTDGTHLLGFHAALLQPAVETERPILPITISYHDATGRHTSAPSFVGEITLIQCLLRILACRTLSVRLNPGVPIDTTGRTRRELAAQAHTVIATAISSALVAPPAGN